MIDKVIFLDFDGVIRIAIDGGGVSAPDAFFCQGRMRSLGNICKQTGARIVVSSDWRGIMERDLVARHLGPFLDDHLHPDWMTPICGPRWTEVSRWLRQHPEVKRYVILEDCRVHFEGCQRDMAERIVWCNNRHGLVPELFARTLGLLLPSPPLPSS